MIILVRGVNIKKFNIIIIACLLLFVVSCDDHTHDFADHYVYVQESTCQTRGYGIKLCTICGYKEREDFDLADHQYNDGEITTPPTCEQEGVRTFTCKNCRETYTQPIPATGHGSSKWVVAQAPTCSEEGIENLVCDVCHNVIDTRPIATIPHSHAERVLTPPTEKDDGLAEIYCPVCSTHIDNKTLYATGSEGLSYREQGFESVTKYL